MSTVAYREVHAGASGLGALFPDGLVGVEAIGDVPPDPLFPIEAELVAGAVEKRRVELARGRSCARRALAALGIAPIAIAAGPDRAPIWPSGVVGSITHCRGYCCAVVAPVARWSAIGIDAEIVDVLEPGVERSILRPAEQRQLATLTASVPWPCVVFSAKEAVYKAWYPVMRRWLEFHDVEVQLDVARGRFTAELVVPDASGRCEGAFAIAEGRVTTLVAIAAC